MESAESTSQFPLPPVEYAHLYTDEAVSSGTIPLPPPPLDGHYTVFGEPCATDEPIIQDLEAQGIRKLTSDSNDPRFELKKLNRSLVAAFLDLVEIMIRCPESNERLQKMDDLRLLFINIHHLINQYRPQQARETLELMMAIQKVDREQAVQKLDQHISNVKDALNGSAEALTPSMSLPDDLQTQIDKIMAMRNGQSSEHNVTKITNDDGDNKSIVQKDALLCKMVDGLME